MARKGLIFNVTQDASLSRPLGGHRIAHYLREQGWDIEVVDWANWWSLEELQEFFRSRYTKDTVFAGFGHLYSLWSNTTEEFGIWIKKHYPNVTLISGSGVNPMFQSMCIDYYIQGFGEYAIVELLKYIAGNGPKPVFNLLGSRKVIPAIDNYPAYPMKSLMVKYEDRDFIQSDEWLTVELSRGCKFKCAFCQFPVLGVKDDSSRDTEDFEIQLRDAYDRFGISSYMIADETLNDRTEKISKFANVVERLNFTPWFSAYIRLDLLAARPLEREELLRMNVLGHYYGIESFNHKSAQAIGKGMKSDLIKQGLLNTRNYFESNGRKLYRANIGLIAGLPYETKETLNNTLTWLVDNWQGQGFGIGPLGVPVLDTSAKPSDIALNISKYGYTEMTPEEIEIASAATKDYSDVLILLRKGNYKEYDQVNWKNENMNIFEAKEITSQAYKIKQQHDFRPGGFMINYRLTKSLNVTERLKLTFPQHDSLLNYNISNYINKKLT
jgi:hypothetical protein